MKIRYNILILMLIAGSLFANEPDTLYYAQYKMRSPALALTLSAVVPGGGQLYNQKLLKSSVFMGTELALGGLAYYHYRRHGEGLSGTLFGNGDPLQMAKEFTWFFAAVYVYSLMDAYVDAHLSNFPDERLILEPDPEINGIKMSLPTVDWFTNGKWAHLTSSYFLTVQSAYIFDDVFHMDHDNSRYFSAGIGLSVSLGKGIFDIFDKKRTFRWENLIYDALGLGLGYLTVMAIQETP